MLALITACDKEEKVYKSPPGYDFAHPTIIKLTYELDEVSGITYYPGDTSIFMQVDEKGNLYKLKFSNPTDIRKWKIADADDYEDIVLLDSTFYVLSSKGDITVVTFLSEHSVDSRSYPFPIPDNEFEILFYDPKIRKLVLICKDCSEDGKKSTSGYAFDPGTKQFIANTFSIDVKKINALAKKKIGRFKPSAAAINPLTGSIYIVSATDKLLVIADGNGYPKAAYELDPSVFKQPEGLTFTPTGTMIITNESADVGMANVLIFRTGKRDNK
jgi:uncharacterized protein YjiK